MTKSIFVIYGESDKGRTTPLHVATTAALAKSWIFDNPEEGYTLKLQEFEIGGTGKPRKPKTPAPGPSPNKVQSG